MKISPTWLFDFVGLQRDLQSPDLHSSEGLREFAEQLTLAGVAVEGIYGSGSDATFEMDVTTNRVDAMNHYGVARECSAIYDVDLKPLPMVTAPGAAASPASATPGSSAFTVQIEDRAGCSRYAARILRDVKIQASSAPIQKRLFLLEQKPINNAADATNYTLLEMGHPTHAFDLDRLNGGKIVVRRAKPGERLKTLDGVNRVLHPDDLVIADAEAAVALAGVMGGFDSMITGSTRNVLIESAWFDPVSIRKSSRRHGLHTDASHRFERGADWGACPMACDRVAGLILQSGGRFDGEMIDVIAHRPEQRVVALSFAELRRILGQEIPAADIERILRRLGFGLAPLAGGYTVAVPTWRLDVEREIDLIEEVARQFGFNRFPSTLPAFSGAVVELPEARKEARVRNLLLALGYNEAISMTFIAVQDAQMFSRATPVKLANPLSEDAPVLRNSLLPGMLNMLVWNMNRGTAQVRLFEAGQIFSSQASQVREEPALCIGATWDTLATGTSPVFQSNATEAFCNLKGDVETLLDAFDCTALDYSEIAEEADYYLPGRSARALFDGIPVAVFGEIHPRIKAARKLRQDVFAAEIYLERLYQHPLRQPQYKKLSRFPAVERDFSFVFADHIRFMDIAQQVLKLGLPELQAFRPAEIFRGQSVSGGYYSALLRATFQSMERTLRDEEVAGWCAQITHVLKALGGVQRA